MFDLRPWAPPDAAEGQIAEGGLNARDNCIPAAWAYVATRLGFRDVEPEQWTLDEYGTPAPGATSIGLAYAEALRLFPTFPPVVMGGPSLGALEANGAAGQLSVILSTVDCASVRYGPGACRHAGVIVAHLPAGWIVWNPWTGLEDVVPEPVLGPALYFQALIGRSIIPSAVSSNLSLGEKRAWAWLAFTNPLILGRVPLTEPEMDAVANVIANDGSNVYEVLVSFYFSPAAVTHRAAGGVVPGGVVAEHHHLPGAVDRTASGAGEPAAEAPDVADTPERRALGKLLDESRALALAGQSEASA